MAEIKIDDMHLERPIEIKGRRFNALLISAQRGIISAVHQRSNGYNLIVTIHNRVFHQSH